MKKINKIFVACLGVLVFATTATLLFSNPKEFSWTERRPLNVWPDFNLRSVEAGEWSKNVDSALADQFPARDELLGLKAFTQKYTAKSDNGRVYFAKKDHLIEVNREINAKQLQRNIDDMIDFYENQFLKTNSGQRGSLVLAPTLAEVGKDLLPAYAPDANQAPLLNEAYAKSNAAGLNAPNLLEALSNKYKNLKNDENLYFRTDHHWTQLGAHTAYLAYLESLGEDLITEEYDIKKVSDDFYGTNWAKASTKTIAPDTVYAYERDALNEVKVYNKDGQLVRKGFYNKEALSGTDPYEYFLGANQDYIRLENNLNCNNKKLLIFKDSFANAFIPFLCERYTSITIVDLRYLSTPVSEILEQGEFTDLMYLYNIVTLAGDNNTYKLVQD